MAELEKLLQQSVEQYQAILDRAVDLAKGLEQAPAQRIEAYCLQMSEMQAKACKTDEVLLPLLRLEKADIVQSALFQERLDLMRQIIEKNKLFSKKTNGMMTFISNEMSQLRHSMRAMAGYKSDQSGKGKRLKGSY